MSDASRVRRAPDARTPFSAEEALARRVRFLEANLSSIPNYDYAFDRERRFAYANPTMLALFGLSAEAMLGRTFADLAYPPDLAARLDRDIDRIFATGETVENEVFFRSPTGHAAHFAYLWGPVRDEDGAVELVVGVSRDTSERRVDVQALRKSEARLRAATELVGIGIYAWDPRTDALVWDDRLRAMWDLPAELPVDRTVFERGIHPDDRDIVRDAIAACVDPAGDGRYDVAYRVIGARDGRIRHVASAGRTVFAHGEAVEFIGAAIDVTAQRRTEAAIRASDAQFRSFAAHSSNLIWIADPAAGEITYRSAAFERIWGVPADRAATRFAEWIVDVHPDDRGQVEHALAAVAQGEVMQYEYRLVRPGDGTIRWLRDTSFPILDDRGGVSQIGGITEDLTHDDVRHVYILSHRPADARKLGAIVRALGYGARTFDSAAAFLEVAGVLAPGCVLVDLRRARSDGLAVPRELKARAIPLPTIAIATDLAGMPAETRGFALNQLKRGQNRLVAALREAMVRRAVRAAEKIRAQDLAATRLIAFAHGSRFKPNAPSASRIARLSPATNDPRVIGGMAGRMADVMYETGGVYTKCGVMLEGLEPMTAHQADLFAVPDPRSPALLAAIDGLNGRFGRNTMRLASEGFGQKSYDTKRAFKSPSWTTRIDQVPIAR